MMYFEVKIKCDRLQESGAQKIVTEAYLINAASFTDAEAKAFQMFENEACRCFGVIAIRIVKVSDVVHGDGSEWYRCKVNFITLDEKSGAEKKQLHTMYVNADSVADANERTKRILSQLACDTDIVDVALSKILEVVH